MPQVPEIDFVAFWQNYMILIAMAVFMGSLSAKFVAWIGAKLWEEVKEIFTTSGWRSRRR